MDGPTSLRRLQIQPRRNGPISGNDAMYYASANDLAQKRQRLSTASTGAEVEIGKQKLQSQQQAITDASQLYGFNNSP